MARAREPVHGMPSLRGAPSDWSHSRTSQRRDEASVPNLGASATVASIDCIDPVDDPAWLALLESTRASLFHSPPWFKVLADAYGFEVRAYIAKHASGAPIGGVPFCEVDDIGGRRLVVLPFSDACDPVFASQGVWNALLARLQSHGLPVNLRCLHSSTVTHGLRVTKHTSWHRLAVASSPEEMWASLAPATRRAIGKAKRTGVEIRPLNHEEGCEGFYRLHVALRKNKYRLLAQPLAFFDAIARHFGEAWFPLGAYVSNRLVATTVYIRWGDTLYYKFNASAQDALAVRPNNLLMWAGMLLAQSLGCRTVDLGPSDDNQPGLVRFKRGFGASQMRLQFLQWTPPGWRDERGSQMRGVLGELARLLTAPEVPDDITAQAGSSFYRYFA